MPRPSKRAPPPTTTTNTATPSPLARQHRISASTELDIKTAFLHLAVPSSPSSSSSPHQNPSTHTLPSSSLKPALHALGIPRLSKRELSQLLDAADPDDTGEISYEAFLGVAALKLSSRDEGDKQGEIDEAFGLFLGEGRGRSRDMSGGGEAEEVITLKTLKRVAEVLKEDVDEKVLRDMILEANGGRGVRAGVGREEFGEVMRRAGVLR